MEPKNCKEVIISIKIKTIVLEFSKEKCSFFKGEYTIYMCTTAATI